MFLNKTQYQLSVKVKKTAKPHFNYTLAYYCTCVNSLLGNSRLTLLGRSFRKTVQISSDGVHFQKHFVVVVVVGVLLEKREP